MSLIALAASGYVGYVGYQSGLGGLNALNPFSAANEQTRISPREQQARIDDLEQRLATLLSTQENAGGEVGRLAQRLTQSEANLGARIQELRGEVQAQQNTARAWREKGAREFQVLADSIVKLRSEVGDSADRWNLEEIEHLLVIANQQLQLSGDIALAGQALKLADRRLRELSDPALAAVREIIATEIVALGRVATVDVAGALNALSALSRGVDDLPLAGDAAPNTIDTQTQTTPAPDTADSASQWWSAGKNMLADLSALVQIETDAETPPILSGELRAMIFEKTKLILESSQLAFLREQDAVYAARMAEANRWVVENFDRQSAEVRAWLAQLAAVAAIAPAAELPDISGSLRALRDAVRAGNLR